MMKTQGRLIGAGLCCLLLMACGGSPEAAEFNVLFYTPEGTEIHLGQVTGLDACQSRAINYGAEHNMFVDYVCCQQTAESSCATKQR